MENSNIDNNDNNNIDPEKFFINFEEEKNVVYSEAKKVELIEKIKKKLEKIKAANNEEEQLEQLRTYKKLMDKMLVKLQNQIIKTKNLLIDINRYENKRKSLEKFIEPDIINYKIPLLETRERQ